jgi:hypothetical protein
MQCVFWYLEIISEKFSFYDAIGEIWYKTCIFLHVNVLVILVGHKRNFNFPGRVQKNNKKSDFVKVPPMDAECSSVLWILECVNVYWTTATWISGRFSTALTEVFPFFFLSCKANARV